MEEEWLLKALEEALRQQREVEEKMKELTAAAAKQAAELRAIAAKLRGER
jgi:hypothetical protein